MNIQMKKYEKYLTSLKNTPEPVATTNLVPIDYKGLIAYAKQKGVRPCDLSDEEKQSFFIKTQAIS